MTDEQRRLAAILVADVVGYSKLMGSDEAGTLAQLQALRTEVIEPQLAKHAGRLFKAVGDGFLIEFASAVQAVSCAIAIQGSNPVLPLRIGVHLGDVIVQGDDLMGDGVNIAARVEGIADAGGIAISRAVHEQVRDKLDLAFTDKGEVKLKNIARPVQVFVIAGAKASVQPTVLSLPDKPSIAVLPFQNMSGDPEQEYFVDGLVDDIITALSHVKWLFVIARNSSFTYKERPIDVKQVGRELGVRYVLEGSIRRAAGRVRITGQLIDAETGAHLWADRFEGGTEDIFELQDQVTTKTVALLTPHLERAEIERGRRKPTNSLDAYDYFLRGRASMNVRTRADIDDALSLFAQAIALDSDFAAAHGAAAFCYVLRKAGGWVSSQQHDIAEADRLARRAWTLDRDDAVSLGFAGYALAYVVGDLSTGAAYVERALTLSPGYENLLCSAWIQIWLGQPDVAIDHVQRALRSNPLGLHTAGMQTVTALAHYVAGRYDDAYLSAGKALLDRPNWAPLLRYGAASAAMAGHAAEAAELCVRLQRVRPDLRISTFGQTQGPYREIEYYHKLVEGLRRAGLPE